MIFSETPLPCVQQCGKVRERISYNTVDTSRSWQLSKCALKVLTQFPHDTTPHLPLHTLTVHSISLLIDENCSGKLFCFIFVTKYEYTKRNFGKFKFRVALDLSIIKTWLCIWDRDSNMCQFFVLTFWSSDPVTVAGNLPMLQNP